MVGVDAEGASFATCGCLEGGAPLSPVEVERRVGIVGSHVVTLTQQVASGEAPSPANGDIEA